MSFQKDGYIVTNLSPLGRELVMKARSIVEAKCGGQGIELYHLYAQNLEQEIHEAREAIRPYPRMIVEAELSLFHDLIGKDLHIQRTPYLRVSRPGKSSDNIGIHRDTWYGDSPYELSVWIPLTFTQPGNALLVAPGSHVWKEEALDSREAQAEKGSLKHGLGYLYAPKRISRPVEMKHLSVEVGQMIVFSLSLLHGQEINTTLSTRISMDVRVAPSMAPVKWERSKENYYEPLSVSPVREQALRYYEAQA